MTHATTDCPREEWRRRLAGLRETAEMRWECKRGQVLHVQQEALEVCTRVFLRRAEAASEGKAVAYRRSTSRKVLGVMPICLSIGVEL
jgi:hypothetical protein